jgi:hypothetical protein
MINFACECKRGKFTRIHAMPCIRLNSISPNINYDITHLRFIDARHHHAISWTFLGNAAGVYLERLEQQGISRRSVRTIESIYSTQCFITTDADNNQITAFHPSAMTYSHANRVADAGPVKLAIVALNGRDGMLQHAEDCVAQGIPLIFDPGQGMPMFNGEALKHFIELETYIAVNDYEAEIGPCDSASTFNFA